MALNGAKARCDSHMCEGFSPSFTYLNFFPPKNHINQRVIKVQNGGDVYHKKNKSYMK